MKKIILLPAFACALLAASCSSTPKEEIITPTTDTAMMPSTPSTDVNGMAPADNTNGGISTGQSDATMKDGSMSNGGMDSSGSGSSSTNLP